jgi:hypothetical protein
MKQIHTEVVLDQCVQLREDGQLPCALVTLGLLRCSDVCLEQWQATSGQVRTNSPNRDSRS